MKNLVTLACGLLLCAVFGGTQAAPSEVLSEISFIEKGGIDAVRLDFAIPVRYISHSPAKHGNSLTIKIGFDRKTVPDTSELPLMQSLYAPKDGPLIEVIYETVSGEPQLQLKFKHEVNFSVSQITGITSLLVFLPGNKPKVPDSQPIAKKKPSVQVSLPKPEASAADTEADLQAKKLLDDGLRALRSEKYKTSIQIFSGIVSMPPNKYSPSALEFLGVARERNNQAAHAKAIYEQYLEQYPEGEGAVRVRQRMAEMLAAELKPQQKLKESPRQKREGEKKVTSEIAGNLSQYFNYIDTQTDSVDRQVLYKSLDTYLSLSWRLRSKDWEFYNYFFGNLDYDTLENDTEGVETSSAYTRIKNRKAGIYATLGRQQGTAAGALGRFDGVYVGYDVMPKIRLNGVWGYPVDISNKRTIQTHKPMLGAGADFLDIVKGLDVSPYYIQQQVDGITDRRAVGTEARYFHPKFNMFSRLDYDVGFSDLNMFFLQGQYIVSKPTSFSLLFDYRKNPFLETSNALMNLGEEVSIKDLLDGTQSNQTYGEPELQDIAKDRTGEFSILSLQINHAFNARQQMTLDFSRSEVTVKVVNLAVNDPTVDELLQTPSTEDNSVQYDASVQLVSSQIFQSKDTVLNFLRYSYAETYDETTYRLEYKIPYKLLFTVEPRFIFKYRVNDTDSGWYRYVPGIRVNYRAAQALRFYMELNYDMVNFNGDNTVQEDISSTNFYFGYNWAF